jgi:flagellar biogenesis protein FliO
MFPALLGLLATPPIFMNYGYQDTAELLKTRESKAVLVEREASKRPASEESSPARLIGWTLFVLALLGAFLYGLRKWSAKTPALGTSELVHILGRRRLNASQEIVLIQVAGRVLVVAATSGGVSVLSEITDRAEIEELRTSRKPGERVPQDIALLAVGNRE